MKNERQRRAGWLARQLDHAHKETRRLPEWAVHTVTTLPVRRGEAMKDERRAWVPVLIGPGGGIYPIWISACLKRQEAIQACLDMTDYDSWRQAYRYGMRMMRCTVEVPKKGRKGR